MRKRVTLLVFPFMLLGLAVWLSLFCTREPDYGGYPLRTWVEALGYLDLQQQGPPSLPRWTRDDIYLAIKHVDTNAFPYLLKWIAYETHSPRAEIAAMTGRFFGGGTNRTRGEIRAFGAARAIQYLGKRASPMIPGLVRLMDHPARPDTAARVLDTLACMGTNGLPHLIASLNNTTHPHRGSATVAISAICKLGPEARPAIPALIGCLRGRDPHVAVYAANALGRLALEPASVIPALQAALQSPFPAVRGTSASALIAFREQAAVALPSLTNLLTDQWQSVRLAASNAIFHLPTPAATAVATNGPGP